LVIILFLGWDKLEVVQVKDLQSEVKEAVSRILK
jgi:hypothetical protein